MANVGLESKSQLNNSSPKHVSASLSEVLYFLLMDFLSSADKRLKTNKEKFGGSASKATKSYQRSFSAVL